MILNQPYIKKPKITGDIKSDAINLLNENGHNSTAEHCVKVADTSHELAKRFGLNPDTAYCSGIQHDITTVIEPEHMMKYAKSKSWDIDASEEKYNFLLHQRASKVVAQDYFNIKDENILSSIQCHTTLKASPSEYDMLLFLADKISWDQNGVPPYLKILKDALDISLMQSCYVYIKYVLNNDLILLPHKWLIEAENWLETRCIK